LATKNVINLISVLTFWWCPCVKLSLVLLKKGVCVLVLGSLVGLPRTDQLQLLQHPWLGHRLGYCDVECSASEINWDNFIIFEVAPNYCILNSCWLWRLHHFLYVILAHSSRYNVHLNLIHLCLSMLVHWFLRWCLLLSSPAWPCLIYLDSWTQHSRFLGNMFFTASDFTSNTRHIHNWESFALQPNSFILSGAVSSCSPLFPSSISDTFWPGGAHLSVSYLFPFLYSSWGSHG